MDISSILIAAASRYPWASSAFAIITTVGFILTHIFPKVPVPPDGSRWVPFYNVLSWIAGNWGNAKNLDAPLTYAPPPGWVRVQEPPKIVPVEAVKDIIPPAVPLSDPGTATKAKDQPPLSVVFAALTFMTLSGVALGMVACTPPTVPGQPTSVVTTQDKVQQAFDLSQTAYTLIAKTADAAITTGLVTPAQAEEIRSIDRTTYAAMVSVRTVVRAGGQPSKVAWAALQTALRAASTIPGVSPETTAAINLAVTTITSLAAVLGN